MASFLTHLECTHCGRIFTIREKQTTCHFCHSPLLARYGLCQFSQSINRSEIDLRQNGIWRWHELLPVLSGQYRYNLGEGDTPLIHLRNTGEVLGMTHLFCKDESPNPSASYSARGACISLSKAAELGIREIAISSDGNEGAAIALYASRLGMDAHVYMPKQSSQSSRNDVISMGGHLHLIDGGMEDVHALLKKDSHSNHWYNLADLEEPYRLEGEKTLGFEIARQMNWTAPDWIIFPAYGLNGLIGLWKAFSELVEMEWIAKPAKMVWALPVSSPNHPDHFLENRINFIGKNNFPLVFAEKMIPEIINGEGVLVVVVPEEKLEVAANQLIANEGILSSPETGAALTVLQSLLQDGTILPNERIVLINTSSGIKNF